MTTTAPHNPSAAEPFTPPGRKVFFVDSDASTRHGAIQALLPHGFEVMVADGPFEATNVILREEPDLVILGHTMTHPFGLALIGRLTSYPKTADTPMLVIANTPEAALAADQSGARSVLVGPTSPSDLLAAVTEHFGVRKALPHAPTSLLEDEGRLAAVEALRPGPDGNPDLDRFTKLTATVLGAPVSLITLIDRDTQILASTTGLDEPWSTSDTMPLEYSYCQYAITTRQPLLIEDATNHPLVRNSPAVADMDALAYAGIPLITDDGHAVGAICAIDHQPRTWTDKDVIMLSALADILTTQLTTAAAGRHSRSEDKGRSRNNTPPSSAPPVSGAGAGGNLDDGARQKTDQ